MTKINWDATLAEVWHLLAHVLVAVFFVGIYVGGDIADQSVLLKRLQHEINSAKERESQLRWRVDELERLQKRGAP